MVNKAKNKGTWWETQVNIWLQALGIDSYRQVLSGILDRGDITWGQRKVVIECKNVGHYQIPLWVQEAETEAINAKAEVGVLLFKVHGKGQVKDAVVAMSPAAFVKLVKAAGWDQ